MNGVRVDSGLVLNDVSVTLSGRTVLAEVSLRVGPGELLGVVGRNGAGKSTLLRLMAGLIAPSRGDVRLDGQPLGTLAPATRAARLGLLAPARLPLPVGYTVKQVVGWARFAHHSWWRATASDDPMVARAVAALELAELADRRMETLSDGERQRVWLAGLVAQEADYLLLDEPTSHLDVPHAIDSLRTIRRWVAGGRGVVLVVHDLDAALAVADRIVLIEAGRIAVEQSVADVSVEELGHRFGVPFAEVALDGQRRLLARGLGEA
jgi:iron complex transport system ATP-binding protein